MARETCSSSGIGTQLFLSFSRPLSSSLFLFLWATKQCVFRWPAPPPRLPYPPSSSLSSFFLLFCPSICLSLPSTILTLPSLSSFLSFSFAFRIVIFILKASSSFFLHLLLGFHLSSLSVCLSFHVPFLQVDFSSFVFLCLSILGDVSLSFSLSFLMLPLSISISHYLGGLTQDRQTYYSNNHSFILTSLSPSNRD